LSTLPAWCGCCMVHCKTRGSDGLLRNLCQLMWSTLPCLSFASQFGRQQDWRCRGSCSRGSAGVEQLCHLHSVRCLRGAVAVYCIVALPARRDCCGSLPANVEYSFVSVVCIAAWTATVLGASAATR
jgi:hypothetical protein